MNESTVLNFYNSRYNSYGAHSPYSLGWHSRESQIVRFKILNKIGDFNRSTILDLGCGFGDLKLFLDRTAVNYNYIGVDSCKKFIDTATANYSNEKHVRFIVKDFIDDEIPKSDFVI